MACVGHEGHRAVEEAEQGLDHDEAGVEHDADQERGAEILGCVMVAVMVVQPVTIGIAVAATGRVGMMMCVRMTHPGSVINA